MTLFIGITPTSSHKIPPAKFAIFAISSMLISLINIDTTEYPESFAIISVGCVWKYLFKSIAEQIKKKTDDGNMFISMEAWFGDYDYAIDTVGVVKRNGQTTFLDACL